MIIEPEDIREDIGRLIVLVRNKLELQTEIHDGASPNLRVNKRADRERMIYRDHKSNVSTTQRREKRGRERERKRWIEKRTSNHPRTAAIEAANDRREFRQLLMSRSNINTCTRYSDMFTLLFHGNSPLSLTGCNGVQSRSLRLHENSTPLPTVIPFLELRARE